MTNPTVKVEDLTGDIDMLVNTRSPKLVGLGERALSENSLPGAAEDERTSMAARAKLSAADCLGMGGTTKL